VEAVHEAGLNVVAGARSRVCSEWEVESVVLGDRRGRWVCVCVGGGIAVSMWFSCALSRTTPTYCYAGRLAGDTPRRLFWFRSHLCEPDVEHECESHKKGETCRLHEDPEANQKMTVLEILTGKGTHFPGFVPLILAYAYVNQHQGFFLSRGVNSVCICGVRFGIAFPSACDSAFPSACDSACDSASLVLFGLPLAIFSYFLAFLSSYSPASILPF
jgi:hypothetical protein